MKPRQYQIEAVEALWREILQSDTALLVASTGLGKTLIFIEFIRKSLALFPELKCIFLVNKINLLEQTVERMDAAFPGLVGAYHGKNKDLSRKITIASIQSISSVDIHFNLLLLDEVHNVSENEGRYLEFITRSKEINSKLKIVGCTATPYRHNGYIYGKNKLFKKPCYERGLLWALENGFLVQPITKAMPDKFETKHLRVTAGDYNKKDLEVLAKDLTKIQIQVSDALNRVRNRKKIVWACTSIEHAESVMDEIISQGEECLTVHSKQEDKLSLDKFRNSNVRHLTFVSIVSEGFDYPAIDTVILMRPTKSPSLYVQTVGRGLRLYPGKDDCLVLDYGAVIENCGPLHAPFVNASRSSKKKELSMKICPSCLSYLMPKEMICSDCKYTFPTKPIDLKKNLTTSAYEGSLTEAPKMIVGIESVLIERYKFKSGSEGWRIKYTTDSIFHRIIYEFFSLKGRYYFQKRLSDLSLKENFGEQIIINNFKAELKRENGYLTIKEIIHVGKTSEDSKN